LYKWAKFQYECGNYSGAADCLTLYRDLSNDNETATAALWGILAAKVLTEDWESAAEDLKALRDRIDSNTFASPISQLQQRTWLLHWSLFVFFNHPQGRVTIVDWFFNEKFLNTIQTTSPHLLRYLAVAVIASKKRRAQLKDLIKVIEQESYHFSDPITEFVEALFVQCDFSAAEQKLQLADQVLSRDIFLRGMREEFVESARLFIFETYCKIHSCLDIKTLATKLSLNADEAERWIVNLIRNARLDAKIDSQSNQILLGANTTSPYQQLIDKTKGLALRSVVLSNNIERARHNTQKKQQQQHHKEEVSAK
jgi:translation initiation factor 3 subunit E